MSKNTVRIPIDNSFSFEECLWFLNRNFDDCIHEAKGNRIRKALLINDEPVLFEISEDDGNLQLQIISGKSTKAILHHVEDYTIEWLDINRNIKPFYKLLNKHKSLSYMLSQYHGLRLIGIPDLFEALAWSIIGQQINLTFAYRLKRRVVEKYGTSIAYDGSVYHIFPSCKTIANAKLSDMRDMQFSTRKAEYLIDLAKAFANGDISKEMLLSLEDCTARQKALINIRGIGIWTANYALMKSLKEPSCIPYGDAGLLNALLRHSIIGNKSDNEKIERLFKQFPGWECYLVFYLWRSLAPTEKEAGLKAELSIS